MKAMAATDSKKRMKRMVREIASSISEELPPGFPKELLEGISTAAHVAMFADCFTFVKTLQRHPKSLIRGTNQNNSIHPLRKNINIVPCPCMTFYYVILEKRSYTHEDTRLHTLISYVLLWMCMAPVALLYVTLHS